MARVGASDSTFDANFNASGLSEKPKSKKQATTVYITEEQQELLKELNRRTRVPIAEFIREGIDLVLERHRAELPGQLDLVFNTTGRPTRSSNEIG